jgi:hypothetical protein
VHKAAAQIATMPAATNVERMDILPSSIVLEILSLNWRNDQRAPVLSALQRGLKQ